MKQHVGEMEQEAKKLGELQAAGESAGSGGDGRDAGVLTGEVFLWAMYIVDSTFPSRFLNLE